jgi:hypothetical protein
MMARYKYQPFEDPNNDIRIAHILPGAFDDRIRLQISHRSLADIQLPAPRPPVDIEKIRASLPDGWKAEKVHEDWDQRVLFCEQRPDNADDTREYKTSWDHPDENFDKLAYRPLEPSPPNVGFDALSYVWGSPVDSVTAEIFEGRSSSTLPITTNLASAIRHLRLADSSRPMWIDAICIDQENIEERASQVRLMTEIYASADRVLVWLGEQSDSSDEAMALLKKLGEGVVFLEQDFMEISPEYTGYQPEPESSRSILELCTRPWFSRVWVSQEFCLGNRWTTLICGHTRIGRKTFRSALSYIQWRVVEVTYVRAKPFFMGLQSELFDHPRGSTYNDLMKAHRFRGCTDLRDKIYGVLGLSAEEFRSAIKPDYSAAIEDVYQTATLAEIQVSHRLDILLESFPHMDTLKTRSWVPDWSVPRARTPSRPGKVLFSCGASVAWAEVENNDLQCQGLQCDDIHFVGETVPGWVKSRDLIEDIVASLGILVSRMTADFPSFSHPQILKALALPLCLGCVQDRFWSRMVQPMVEDVVQWLSFRLGYVSTHTLQHRQTASVEQNLLQNLPYSNMFITTRGNIGIGTPGMKIGKHLTLQIDCTNVSR